MPSAILKENLLEEASLTSSTEDSEFPLSNLFDGLAASQFSFTSTAGGWIEIDNGAAKAFDTLHLVNHNFDSSVDIDVYAGASPNPGTPIATNLTYREFDLWKDLGSQSARYVRVVITDSNSENTRLGELRLGTRVEFPQAHRFGKIPGKVTRDIYHETQADVAWVYHVSKREIRELEWRILESDLTKFEALFDDVLGRAIPFSFILKTTEADVMLVRFTEPDWRPRELSEPMPEAGNDLSFTVKEESRGVLLG